jgi:hypothetical protein
MNAISLSNNTVQRRIGEMAENVMKQLTWESLLCSSTWWIHRYCKPMQYFGIC